MNSGVCRTFYTQNSALNANLALGSTDSLTEIGTRNLPVDKGQTALKADNLRTICEPII
jgi:hypothetical protein